MNISNRLHFFIEKLFNLDIKSRSLKEMKKIGNELDIIAYTLYVNRFNKDYNWENPFTAPVPCFFIDEKLTRFEDFYNLAELKIRKQKIKNIKSKINE